MTCWSAPSARTGSAATSPPSPSAEPAGLRRGRGGRGPAGLRVPAPPPLRLSASPRRTAGSAPSARLRHRAGHRVPARRTSTSCCPPCSAAIPAWRDAGPLARAALCLEILTRINAARFELAQRGHAHLRPGLPDGLPGGRPARPGPGARGRRLRLRGAGPPPGAAEWEKPQGKRPPLRMRKRSPSSRGASGWSSAATPSRRGTATPACSPTWPPATRAGQAAPAAPSCRSRSPSGGPRGARRGRLRPDLVCLAAEAPGGRLAATLAVRPEIGIVDYTGSTAFGDWLEENARQAQVYTEKAGVNAVVVDSTDDYRGMLRTSPSRCRSTAARCARRRRTCWCLGTGSPPTRAMVLRRGRSPTSARRSTGCSATTPGRRTCSAPIVNADVLARIEASPGLGGWSCPPARSAHPSSRTPGSARRRCCRSTPPTRRPTAGVLRAGRRSSWRRPRRRRGGAVRRTVLRAARSPRPSTARRGRAARGPGGGLEVGVALSLNLTERGLRQPVGGVLGLPRDGRERRGERLADRRAVRVGAVPRRADAAAPAGRSGRRTCMTVPTRRRYDVDSLLAVAVAVFTERGYDGTSWKTSPARPGCRSRRSTTTSTARSSCSGPRSSGPWSPCSRSPVSRAPSRAGRSTGSSTWCAARWRCSPTGSVRDAAAARARRHGGRAVGAGAAARVRPLRRRSGAEAAADGDVQADLDPAVVTRLLFGMINSLVEWYRPDGPASGARHTRMAPADLAGSVVRLASTGSGGPEEAWDAGPLRGGAAERRPVRGCRGARRAGRGGGAVRLGGGAPVGPPALPRAGLAGREPGGGRRCDRGADQPGADDPHDDAAATPGAGRRPGRGRDRRPVRAAADPGGGARLGRP